MHYRAIAGPRFGRLNPLIMIELGREHHILILDLAFGWYVERIHVQHQIRRRNIPAVHVFARRRRVFRVAFFRAAIRPGHQRIDLLLAQRAIVGEMAVLRVGEPGRHLLRQDVFLYGFGPRARVFVRHQRERSDLARAMALLTMLLDDFLHIPMERHLSWNTGCPGCRAEDECRREKFSAIHS